jgi:Flp pilus assembly protein CpaB
MTYRLRNIVLAVALAALAALLTSLYVANYKKTVRDDEASVTVYVAAKQIPVGTTGADAVSKGFLKTEDVARRSVVPGAISSPREIRDLVATETVYEGEQVSIRRFRPTEASGIQADLKGNLRAIQVNGNGHQLLAGTLKHGDRVDVVATFNYKWVDFHGGKSQASDTLTASRVVLRDIKVLKAPGGPAAGSKLTGGVDQKFPVLLAVTDSQAQKLLFIVGNSSQGDSRVSAWSLELRPVVHAADSPDHVDRVSSILLDGLNPAQRRALVP